jgi:uncharacterized membrane protein YgcG
MTLVSSISKNMSSLKNIKYSLPMTRQVPLVIIFLLFIYSPGTNAQTVWPKKIKAENGAVITMYQPTPETFADNHVKFRNAISIEPKPKADLIFGAMWADAKVLTDRETRMVSLESVKVMDVKFPDETDTSKIEKLKTLLEAEIPKWKLTVSLDELITMVEEVHPKVSEDLKNDPPKIIFKEENSTLIMIDGEPKVEMDTNLKMNKVKNTPFLILQNDKNYYLYGGKFWYKSKSITEGWEPTEKLPTEIAELDKQIKAKQTPEQKAVGEQFKTPSAIVVSTVPAELICSDGKANLQPIDSTHLLYVANSNNNIFMDIASQMYFTLISGRWYKSKTLDGPYEFVNPEKIPSDFALIPEGSEKDIVLASVPGTPAAREAVMDAQIPQTAKVDRKTATTEVKFDGEPKYEKIEGTNMEVGKNTSSTVIKDKDKYYAVKDGIWFMGVLATGGLLAVATDRPSEVEKIPPSSEVYNTKYVEIYETTPEYVYVGYTPGYMGTYVAGPVVVYGTGYYYNPWFGPYYYPHPMTYGFGMAYNPYYGYSMGFAFSVGFFAGAAYGGYWGCHGYHPPYHGHYGHGGYYGHGGNHVNHYGNTNINVDRNNNVYRGNNGVNTNDIKRNSPSQQPARGQGSNRPSAGQQPAGGGRGPSAGQQPAGGNAGGSRPSAGQQPAGGNPGGSRPSAGQQPANGAGGSKPSAGQQPAGGNQGGKPSASQQPSNNVRTDRDGNVYKQGNDGNWQQRNNSNSGWDNSSRSSSGASQMDRQQNNSNRGQTRSSNYGGSGGGSRGGYSGGGGSRGGGGGRGGGGRR